MFLVLTLNILQLFDPQQPALNKAIPEKTKPANPNKMSFATIFFSYYIVLVSTAEPQNAARHQLPLPLFSPIYSPFLQLNYPESTRLSDSIKTVEVASKLTVSNLKTAAYKLRSSGKQIETEKARKADVLKISFTIAENKVAKKGDKTYYVQVIDSKNNVLGEKKTESFGSNSLTYSFETTVKYENKSVNVTQDLPGQNFEKGTYFVNVFDKGELVSKSSFSLR